MSARKTVMLAVTAFAGAGLVLTGTAAAAPAEVVASARGTHRPAAVVAAMMAATAPTYTIPGKSQPIASNQRGAAVHPDGFEPASVVKRGTCKGWINTKKIGGRWNAQGLVYSSSTSCGMKLERSHNGGKYKLISNYYLVKNGGQVNTGWHYDGRGYKTRVCINLRRESSWHCGKGI
ncbi:hypothetical protein [Actinoallomurus soli]|uniref:hypothetical protein n=1 Tax=Actinoallomurus soli TaxID=2952535 RepID=UPI0020927A16|nr:hypothetical protein [Actinoallomurus soli]MCO5971891.1 hypothetical protein [Actinoallomurus soli]